MEFKNSSHWGEGVKQQQNRLTFRMPRSSEIQSHAASFKSGNVFFFSHSPTGMQKGAGALASAVTELMWLGGEAVAEQSEQRSLAQRLQGPPSGQQGEKKLR